MDHDVKGLEHEVAYPKEQDYHGHPNYMKIYLFLLALFGISLAAGYIEDTSLMMIVVFGAALCKAALVVGQFMHLKWEPLMVWIAVGVVVFILGAFYFGVYPDIPMVEPDVVKP